MTIVEAIKKVMLQASHPLSSRQVFDAIVAQELYQFQAKDPHHVVLMQIRRHCVGIDFPTASPTKHFELHGENTYVPLEQPTRQSNSTVKVGSRSRQGKKTTSPTRVDKPDFRSLSSIEKSLWAVHKRYLTNFKQKCFRSSRK